jgi:hypothetical protein
MLSEFALWIDYSESFNPLNNPDKDFYYIHLTHKNATQNLSGKCYSISNVARVSTNSKYHAF